MPLHEGLDAPEPWRPGTAGAQALVMVSDQRAALAAVLVLQEMGLSVDIAADPAAALSWARMSRYRVVVAAGSADGAELALRLRYAAPRAQLIMLADRTAPIEELTALGVEVLRPPINVNALVSRLSPPRAA